MHVSTCRDTIDEEAGDTLSSRRRRKQMNFTRFSTQFLASHGWESENCIADFADRICFLRLPSIISPPLALVFEHLICSTLARDNRKQVSVASIQHSKMPGR